MTRSIFFAFLLLVFSSACSHKAIPALTEAQNASIEEEVLAQHDVFVSALEQIDYELWVDCYSKDNFISALSYPVVDPYDYERWTMMVKGAFTLKIKHETEIFDIKVTPLAPDLAISTQFGRWKNWWTDRDPTNNAFHASFLWKKEADGWKIIQVTETGFPEFE